ncbi:MAG: type 1 glutamine amidotransferase [Moorellaceae bacterium]
MKLRIAHLYPELLNLYGDRGNILVLRRRAEWRGIQVEITCLSLGDRVDPRAYDLFFLGGGPDQEQGVAGEDLLHKGPYLKEAVQEGAALLAICGGYQLLGRYYRTSAGEVLPGVGLFPVYTEAGKIRLKGNIAIRVESLPDSRPVIGFENHAGRTFLEDQEYSRPLGRIIFGRGNNGMDGTEGCIYCKAIGSYLHGPLLAKNPHLADYILTLALEKRYGQVELSPLDDGLEWQANREVFRRFRRPRSKKIFGR